MGGWSSVFDRLAAAHERFGNKAAAEEARKASANARAGEARRTSVVRYAKPVDAVEAALRFRVLELRGDRVLLELIGSGMPIAPTEVVALAEVVGAEDEDKA